MGSADIKGLVLNFSCRFLFQPFHFAFSFWVGLSLAASFGVNALLRIISSVWTGYGRSCKGHCAVSIDAVLNYWAERGSLSGFLLE